VPYTDRLDVTHSVFQEIEKVEDQKALWSLLMPWELGSFLRLNSM